MRSGVLPDSHGSFVLGTLVILVSAVLPWRELDELPGIAPAPDEIRARADEYAHAMGLFEAQVYVWHNDVPDAIPLGNRSGGILVLTSGLVALLDDEALDAAIAHELGHVRHAHARRFSAWVAVVLGSICTACLAARRRSPRSALPMAVVGVVLGLLLLLAVTRQYEREADRCARRHLEHPEALARAILAVRTGNPSVTPDDIDLTRPRRIRRLLAIYPPLDERFPELIADD